MSNSEEAVNYEEFERLHVVRRLRQIVGNWWKVQLNFTDANGFLRGVPQGRFFNPANPVCKIITENDLGFIACRNEAKDRAISAIDSPEATIAVCHAGFSTLTLPLRIGGKFLGCIFADGFILQETEAQQKQEVKNYLNNNPGINQDEVEDIIASLPVLTNREVEYLTELIGVVVEETISLRKVHDELDERVKVLSRELDKKYDFSKMVGNSPAMQSVTKILTRVCSTDTTILITGENGTGKEVIARAIHYNSKRKGKNFIVQNCGALNDNLLESELFGHVKGAFTNAIRDKKGLFEVADKGTLFLDEIGDTSPAMQVKLLRVLQEGSFMPVGDTQQRMVDVRVLAATNKNLEQMVEEGLFRQDLYYRLNVINVKVPPLRERRDDIPILVQKFLEDHASGSSTKMKKIDQTCMKALVSYDWPGNVRELQNEVERLCVLSGTDPVITIEVISDRIINSPTVLARAEKSPGLRMEGKLKDVIEELERKMIFEALIKNNFNKSKVSRSLGISRAGLILKCDKYGISKDDRYKSADE